MQQIANAFSGSFVFLKPLKRTTTDKEGQQLTAVQREKVLKTEYIH